jgi:flagellar motor protein MotB
MNTDKRLEDLIDNSNLSKNELTKKIMSILYKTNDALKVKAMTEKVINQDFYCLKDSEKEAILSELSKTNTKINKEKINKTHSIDSDLKKQLNEMAKKLKDFENELKIEKEEKEKLMNILKLTSFGNIVEASDKDIDDLYLDILKNNKIDRKGNAIFVKNNNKKIILKSYYEF